MNFETLAVSEADGVARIELSRPDKANAFNGAMWKEIKAAFEWLSASELRVGVLSGQGKHFTAGVDLEFLVATSSEVRSLPEGRRQERLRDWILDLQSTISAAEFCRKPVLAAVHGACIGAGIDLVTACDMRYATHDARFSVKEIDVAIVADVGTLQRLPRLVGDGLARELAYTGREFDGHEARAMGLVNQVFPDKDSLMKHVMALATSIARKSPLTVRGIKDTLNYSRDHSVAAGLEYVALRNAGALLSSDLDEAIAARSQKRDAVFRD
jgi:enoyl-CoA hydratase